MSSNRPERVGSLIGQVISQTLLQDMHDAQYRRIVVTETRMTKDLRIAHVYYTLIGETQPAILDAAEKALEAAVPFLRRQIGRSVRLRFTPTLTFHFDETLERARRLEDLLSGIQPLQSVEAPEDPMPGDDDP